MVNKNTLQSKKRVLRQRKNHGGQSLVERVQLVINYHKKEQTHDILFDEVCLTPQEMYSRGFLGDIELPGKEDAPIEATVEAGPIGEFSGSEVGSFVFRVYETQSLKPVKPHMTKVTCFLMPQRTRCALMVPLEADRTALPTYGRDSTSAGLRRQRGIQTN